MLVDRVWPGKVDSDGKVDNDDIEYVSVRKEDALVMDENPNPLREE